MWMGRESQGSDSGDQVFVGIDEKTPDPAAMAPGFVRKAYNTRIQSYSQTSVGSSSSTGNIGTRGGLTQASSFNAVTYGTIFGKGYFVDPVTGIQWLLILVKNGVWAVSDGQNPQFIALPTGVTISQNVDLCTAYGVVTLPMGPGVESLAWQGPNPTTGLWLPGFVALPNPPTGFSTIPPSITAEFIADRVVVPFNIDEIAVSEVGNPSAYSTFADDFNINQGDGDSLVRCIEWYNSSVLFFKTRSIYLAQGFTGDLSSMSLSRVAKGYGLCGRKAVILVGNDLFFMSPGGAYRMNQIFEDTPEIRALPISDPLIQTMKRVNWAYGSGIIAQFRNDRVYFAVPLDGASRNNALLVYNVVREAWESVDTFPNTPSFGIDDIVEAPYNGERRIFAMDCVTGMIYLMEDESSVDYFGDSNSSTPIFTYILSRGYTGAGVWNAYRHLRLGLRTWNPSYSINVYSSGVGSKQVLAENITADRTEYYGFQVPNWVTTNVNDDWGTRGRKDYSVLLPMAINNSGVILDQKQDFKAAYPIRVPGRYAQLEITNTQGALELTTVDFESWEDQRADRTAAT